MELYLLRHGDAIEGFPDRSRLLSAFGREQVSDVALAHRLACEGIEKVVSSPYTRAAQTAEIFVRGAGLTKTIDWLNDLTPQGDLRAIEEFLQNTEVESVLLVSHLPLVSLLIDYLTGESGIYMGTGSLASLSMPFAGREIAQLNWIQHAAGIS